MLKPIHKNCCCLIFPHISRKLLKVNFAVMGRLSYLIERYFKKDCWRAEELRNTKTSFSGVLCGTNNYFGENSQSHKETPLSWTPALFL